MRISREATILFYLPVLAEWVFCSARSENSSRGSQKLTSRKPMI
jgi:hypothetical protein